MLLFLTVKIHEYCRTFTNLMLQLHNFHAKGLMALILWYFKPCLSERVLRKIYNYYLSDLFEDVNGT